MDDRYSRVSQNTSKNKKINKCIHEFVLFPSVKADNIRVIASHAKTMLKMYFYIKQEVDNNRLPWVHSNTTMWANIATPTERIQHLLGT